MDKLEILVSRLDKIGIDIKLTGNFPWVYMESLNGKKVTEKHSSRYGFTIAYLPIRKSQEIKFVNISGMFKLIRKYHLK
jgi:hypothetical protein